MKKKEQRLNDIMALVREQPTISIKELAKILDVSEMTIRRDISYLKESNAMTQMLGMNVISTAPAQPPLRYDFQYELERNVEAKGFQPDKTEGYSDPGFQYHRQQDRALYPQQHGINGNLRELLYYQQAAQE